MSVKLDKSLKWLNYHHLYYFYIIAKEGSIAKAAERLKLGQPSLSTQLKSLEESLGKPLFDRNKQRLSLTESGRVALKYAEQIFYLGSEMVEVLSDTLTNNKVHIQIGASDSVPKAVVMELVSKAYEFKNCSVSVLEGSSRELLKELYNHRIDLVISNDDADNEYTNIYSKLLTQSPIVICAHPKYKKLKNNFPHSLDGQPFILPTKHSRLRVDLDLYFSKNEIKLDMVAETQDTSLQRLLGEEGFGIIPVSEESVREQVKEKKLIVLGALENHFEDYWLMAADRKITNPVAAYLFTEFSIK